MRPPYKTTWTLMCNIPGVYLVLPGSNSVWAGFQSEEQANTCALVLPGWRVRLHI